MFTMEYTNGGSQVHTVNLADDQLIQIKDEHGTLVVGIGLKQDGESVTVGYWPSGDEWQEMLKVWPEVWTEDGNNESRLVWE